MKKSLIILTIVGLLFLGGCAKKTVVETDGEKFASEYSKVDKDNNFVYKTDKEIINILKNGTGVVYLGFPECPWCQAYVPMLESVSIENNIDTIYYLNVLDIRKNNTTEYQEIVSILKDYLPNDDEGNKRIYVPAVITVNDGKITGFDDETSKDTHNLEDPADYWTEDEVKDLKAKFKTMFKTLSNTCTDCNK